MILRAAVLLLASSVSPAPVWAEGPPPNRDPSAVEAEFDAVAVLAYFGAVMGLLSQG